MNNYNLFIIESPLQLLNAEEAKYYFPSKKNILLVKYSSNKKNNMQITKILKMQKWDYIYNIQFIYSKIVFLPFIFTLIQLKLKYKYFNKIFIGEFRSDYMWLYINNIKHEKSVLLDDGTLTILVQNKYLEDINKYNEKRSKSKDFIFSLFLFKNSNRKMIDLFTMFKFKTYHNQILYHNNFNFMNSKMSNCKLLPGDQVFFIGGDLVELKIISLDYFYECIDYIKKFYQQQNKTIIYLPHRGETNNKLEILENKFHFNITYFENPIELELLYKRILPVNIASFYSTALITLKNIYNIKNIDSFKLDINQINHEHQISIEEIYKYYNKEFNIVEMSYN